MHTPLKCILSTTILRAASLAAVGVVSFQFGLSAYFTIIALSTIYYTYLAAVFEFCIYAILTHLPTFKHDTWLTYHVLVVKVEEAVELQVVFP